MIFVLALLGGLILNLMPCVLPVLAIKIGSVLDAAGQQKSLVRARFLSAAGIVTSFVILAAVLATMRLVGARLAGVQFQSPMFLSVMMLLIALFVLAVLDRLNLPVPSLLSWTSPSSATVTAAHAHWRLFDRHASTFWQPLFGAMSGLLLALR